MMNVKKCAAALSVAAVVSVGGAATATMPAWADSVEGEKKVFVCKFVGTPGVDERLQMGGNPLLVSVNSIPIFRTDDPAFDTAAELIGKEFADGQGRSVVIAAGDASPAPTAASCQALLPPATVTAVAPTFVDPCGPDNEVLTLATTEGVTYSQVTVANVITVTATANEGFVLSAPATFTFTVNDAACLQNVTAVAATFTDPCGPDNEVVTLATTEGVTYSHVTVGNVITVTATANEGFVLTGPATFDFTINDAACAGGGGQVLGEEASNNNGGNNNDNNGNGVEVQGQQASAPQVQGQQASAPAQAPAPAVAAQQQAVPTSVNAGMAGSTGSNFVLPAGLAMLGALFGMVAFAARRRA